MEKGSSCLQVIRILHYHTYIIRFLLSIQRHDFQYQRLLHTLAEAYLYGDDDTFIVKSTFQNF